MARKGKNKNRSQSNPVNKTNNVTVVDDEEVKNTLFRYALELAQEKYDLTCKLQFSAKTSKGSSYTNEVTIFESKGVDRDKVVSTLNKYSGKSTGYRVTKDGIYSSANNLDYEN